MYPHVIQFRTRRREIADQFREATQMRAGALPTTNDPRGVRERVAIALRLLSVLSALTLAGLVVAPSALANGDLTRVGGKITYDSLSQNIENLTITRKSSVNDAEPPAFPVCNSPTDNRSKTLRLAAWRSPTSSRPARRAA